MKPVICSMASGVLGAALLASCTPPTGPTETVRNDLFVAGSPPTTFAFSSIEVRFRGQDDPDIVGEENGAFSGNIIPNGLPAAAFGAVCQLADDCGDNPCVPQGGGMSRCLEPADANIDGLECGIYDARITRMDGTVCERLVNPDNVDATGQACSVEADCPAQHRCRGGECLFQYRGDGLRLCFAEERWDLSLHVGPGLFCADLVGM